MQTHELKQHTKEFLKKTALRIISKVIEITALFAIGSALGLKLVRY
jgi:hypothetical protein